MRAVMILSLPALCIGIGVSAAPVGKEREKEDGPPTFKQHEASVNKLKQIALSWHNYESAYANLPNNIVDKAGKPLLSWRVAILPFIEEETLYKEFKLDEPWDSEHNKKLISKMPDLFLPVRGKADKGTTFYLSFNGKLTVLNENKKHNIVATTDGTSNTFMLAEAARPVVWTKPDDLQFDGKLNGDSRVELGGMFNGHFHIAFIDGSVHFVDKSITTKALRAFITTSGGEVVDFDKDLPKCEIFKK